MEWNEAGWLDSSQVAPEAAVICRKFPSATEARTLPKACLSGSPPLRECLPVHEILALREINDAEQGNGVERNKGEPVAPPSCVDAVA
jgi:hypothetical protein